MNTKTHDALTGINILKKAKKHNGEFILQQLNSEITKIVKAIRQSPSKGGSLNIHIEFKPHSSDGQHIATIVDIRNVKAPVIDPMPIFGFSTMDGELSSKDPSQVDMFDETTEIDMETGEIKPIKDGKSNIKSIN